MNERELHDVGQSLFTKKGPIDSLWQEIAANFYPERADFTTQRSMGDDFASNLMSSYPILCRRDLGNHFGAMLRPTAKPWFHVARRHEMNEQNETREWLQYFADVQRRAMYDSHSHFTRATKEGDHDFAAFGQCAISVELNSKADTMLYRCWHLRDMAWQENQDGHIGTTFRKWKPGARQLARTFPGKVDKRVEEIARRAPFEELDCMHMVVDADMYDGNAKGRPRWSIWYDVTHGALIEAVPIWGRHYVIPRWQTVSSSQYSYSPATVAALPEARLLQAMTYTLLEAGEKATNPPVIATQDAVRSDIALYAGGITWVEQDYDEKTGEALRPLTQDFKGFNFGLKLNEDSRATLFKAFYLNAMTLPERASGMSEYEIGERIQEYIRGALPLFEPMEMEYNAAICEESFDLLWRNGAFGSPLNWPKALQGAEIEFRFESPLHDAIEQGKAQKLAQAAQLMAPAIQLDPSVAIIVDAREALRDALNGIGVPARWMRSEDEVAASDAQKQADADAAKLLAGMQQGSEVAANLAGAQKDTASALAVGA